MHADIDPDDLDELNTILKNINQLIDSLHPNAIHIQQNKVKLVFEFGDEEPVQVPKKSKFGRALSRELESEEAE